MAQMVIHLRVNPTPADSLKAQLNDLVNQINEALSTVGGGGSGGFFELESGSSPVKVSAFSPATTPDGTELIPGVQGGANVGFTAAQLLSSTSNISIHAGPGSTAFVYGGSYSAVPTGDGGNAQVLGGNGGYTSGNGGAASIYGGVAGAAGNGGDARVYSGSGAGGGNHSGNVVIKAFAGNDSATDGFVFIKNLPTVDPAVADALWYDVGTGILMKSP